MQKHYHFDWSAVPAEAARLCKWSDAGLDPSLRYLKSRFPAADAWQIAATGTKDFLTREGIRVAPALALLKTLV